MKKTVFNKNSIHLADYMMKALLGMVILVKVAIKGMHLLNLRLSFFKCKELGIHKHHYCIVKVLNLLEKNLLPIWFTEYKQRE